MRKIILYIAMSLDGYIADKNYNISWLSGDGSDEKNIGSYDEFIKSVDTILLGSKTYNQIVSELSPDFWVYSEQKTFVLTNKDLTSCNEIKKANDVIKNEDIIFTNDTLLALVENLKAEKGKNIWICGGAQLVKDAVKDNLIDIYHITVIPTILGDGIHLFTPQEKELKLKFVSMRQYNGIVDLVYKKRC